MLPLGTWRLSHLGSRPTAALAPIDPQDPPELLSTGPGPLMTGNSLIAYNLTQDIVSMRHLTSQSWTGQIATRTDNVDPPKKAQIAQFIDP